MTDLVQLQILAQLLDNLTIITKKLEKSYNENDAEMFKRTKEEMFGICTKISGSI